MILLRAVEIGWAGLWLLLVAAFKPTRRRLATRVRRTLERLGPAFVKLGQALSQRRDILGLDWIAELTRLQESVRPFPGEAAQRAVEAAFGGRLSDHFERFDIEPLASASVAQVHRAWLRDGREVIVKVLRPGVRVRIDEDMRILLALVTMAAALIPELRKRQSPGVVAEIRRNLRRETDLREEARNVRRFARAFAASEIVAVPDVIDGLSSSDVLVQEFSHGLHLGDPRLAPQAQRLSSAFIDFYLEQFFVAGFFHADPHPGNIFVLDDGRLCFHDFGAVGFLDATARQALLSFVQGFIHQDADWLTEAAADLGLISASADREAVARGVDALLAELAGAPLAEWSIATVMLAVARFGGGGAVILPSHLAALVRTVFTAEGTLRLLDPKLDVIATLAEKRESLTARLGSGAWIEQRALARLKWEGLRAAHDAPSALARGLAHLREGKGLGLSVRVEDLARASERTLKSANRIALALVTLGLYIAASLLMQHSIGPRLWGDLPVLAAVFYALALWFTLRLVVGMGRDL
ncbi:MAG: ABC transporter [Alphaproteobacteria bacterium]|nr:MAG: ABC transporter [Alphaproteobacteria bacterium]